MTSSADAAKLSQVLKRIQDDIAKLKGGASTGQLQNTSIEVTQGRGFIPILENGEVKHVIGRQPDGTITSVSVNNRTAPVVPARPTCTPGIQTVTVACDGFTSQQYLDFSHINIYCDGALTSTLMKVPESTVIGPLTIEPHRFSLTSVNLSGTESGHTDDVIVTPKQVVADDLSQDVFADLQLADGEVTAAKIAAGAITSIAIAPQAIETVNIDNAAITNALLAAGAVQSSNLDSGAVQTGNIASGAVTSTQIAANAVTSLQLAANSVTAGAILAGAITTSALAANAVTAAKIAANTITASQIAADTITSNEIAANTITANEMAANSIVSASIVASAIQAAHIATGTITADKLVAGTITSDKLAANSVTAINLAANAVTAGSIQAGAIDASKLAAQVIIASSQIIIGSLLSTRVVLDNTGITQVDNRGNVALQIGASSKGNSFTVIDPADATNALASIGADGSMTMSGISISGKATLNGVDLVALLNNLPKGVVARGSIGQSATVTVGASVGWFEFGFDAIAGRIYRFMTNPIVIYTGTLSACGLNVSYTTDGSVPRTTSTAWSNSRVFRPTGSQPYYPFALQTFTDTLVATVTGKYRCLLWLDPSADGGAGNNGVLSGTASNTTILNLVVEDLGFGPAGPVGGSNAGGGTSSATQQTVKTYLPTYCAYYGDTGVTTATTGLQMGQAGSVNYMSMIGFDYTTIVSDLTGATIDKVELFLYSNYWALSSGGMTCVGMHNVTGSTPPASYSFSVRDSLDQGMKKPQGLWLQLPTSVGTALKGGTAKGIVLDSRAGSPGTGNFATYYDNTYIDSTLRPQLRITYRK